MNQNKDLIASYQEKNNNSLLFSKFSKQKLDKLFLILAIVYFIILALKLFGVIDVDAVGFIINNKWVQILGAVLLIDLVWFYIDSARIQGYKEALEENS